MHTRKEYTWVYMTQVLVHVLDHTHILDLVIYPACPVSVPRGQPCFSELCVCASFPLTLSDLGSDNVPACAGEVGSPARL